MRPRTTDTTGTANVTARTDTTATSGPAAGDPTMDDDPASGGTPSAGGAPSGGGVLLAVGTPAAGGILAAGGGGAWDPAPAGSEAGDLDRRGLITEIWLLLGVSLGMSGLFALIRYIGAVTSGPVRGQVALLNRSAAPGRPWLDLALQLAGLLADVIPAFLAIHLLSRHWGLGAFGRAQEAAFRASSPPQRGRVLIGLDRRRLGVDVALGAAIAACVGGTGLGLYLLAWHSGANLTVAPSGLPAVWWRIPVLLLSALQNAVTEEVIVAGYLLVRLRELGWGNRRALAASALLRGSYHLYQGLGGFFGNLAMGVLFGWLFQRRGRVLPLIVAHTLIDSVAFVGYVALAGSVSWLPTPG